MKRILLSLTLLIGFAAASNAQCTPDPLYMDSTYGAWPDTTTNLAPGMVGVAYLQVLDFKLPTDAGDIDPTYNGIPIDSAVLTNVTGLPAGLNYVCNVSSCTWYGGEQGCATLAGTPTMAGTYDVVIELDGWVTIPFVGAISQATTFTGYKIVVSPATGITLLNNKEFKLAQNTPNPFSEETTINFVAGEVADMTFRVTDLLGNLVHSESFESVNGDNSLKFRNNGLSDGIYTFTLSNGATSVTKKMVVRK